jgi:hypothetical protein
MDYAPRTVATRILSCGEGEQLGHPGRNVTRKVLCNFFYLELSFVIVNFFFQPRAIDTFPQGTRFLQVAAGGVHSVVLTEDGKIYSCGVNEKGTVPVEGLLSFG